MKQTQEVREKEERIQNLLCVLVFTASAGLVSSVLGAIMAFALAIQVSRDEQSLSTALQNPTLVLFWSVLVASFIVQQRAVRALRLLGVDLGKAP